MIVVVHGLLSSVTSHHAYPHLRIYDRCLFTKCHEMWHWQENSANLHSIVRVLHAQSVSSLSRKLSQGIQKGLLYVGRWCGWRRMIVVSNYNAENNIAILSSSCMYKWQSVLLQIFNLSSRNWLYMSLQTLFMSFCVCICWKGVVRIYYARLCFAIGAPQQMIFSWTWL